MDIFKIFGASFSGIPKSQKTYYDDNYSSEKRGFKTPIRILISIAATLLFGFIYFYIELPAINVHSHDLYWLLFLLCIVFTVLMILLGGFRSNSPTGYIKYARKKLIIPFYFIVAIIAVVAIGTITGLVIFRSGAYASLISVDDGDFASEVAEISFDQIPMLDEKSANNLADRKLGELSDLVSQFEVSSSSAQINYNGSPVRVSYLNYGSIFKWWANRSQGIPAYMIIDMVTQEVNVVRLDEGIKYSPSEYFGRDLNRHLRFNYPTKMFSDVNFEIDEDGTPYWVASVINKKIGLFGGEDVVGAVLLNAVTGESQYYDVKDVPKWVDRVYSASIIIDQYNYYGKYKTGFWNSLFGQKNCTATTSGYNYIAQNDDVWLYTGITSVTGDRGNIGFILVNQRTKEANYYTCAGAEEFSAMSSAEGAVQQYSYVSTFPLLLNISDQPTYFMALKDAAGLVKMYAMVNVQQYQIVATGTSVEECLYNYTESMSKNNIISDEIPDKPEEDHIEVSGNITEIRSAIIDGNTYLYFLLDGINGYFRVSAKDYQDAVILNVGDYVTFKITGEEENITEAQLAAGK